MSAGEHANPARYLLDVNMLVAWGWADHLDHERVAEWIAARLNEADPPRLMTSPIPELGFVRVSVHRGGGQVSPGQASSVLESLIATLGTSHEFLADDRGARMWPDWCRGAARTTDAHLLGLAESHGAELATLDLGIPGAFVIP